MFIPTIQEIKKVIREDIKKRITFMDKLIEFIKNLSESLKRLMNEMMSNKSTN